MLTGREHECSLIDRRLAEARAGRASALVVLGEAGIGKTALLEYARASAGEMTVVRALGVESEAEVEYSGLLEVCRPLLAALSDIPAGQAAALRGALGLGEPARRDRFTIGAATLNLFAAAGERVPLLVTVDDAHWLDRASAEALLFAARRLDADAVAMLFAVRAVEEQGVAAAGLEQLMLGPLAHEAALELLARSGTIVRGVADLLYEATAGNPLALLELPRLLSDEQLAGREPIAEPLPTPTALEAGFADRAAQLPSGTRRALVIAAALSAAEPDVLSNALRAAELEMSALEAAEDAGLVAVVDGRLDFRHPLVRSALYQAAAPSERRAAHRAAASALEGTPAEAERRAWHLAAAALGPDETAASELERAGLEAIERAGYATATAALARAAQLTSDAGLRATRLFEAAEAAWHAGDPERARALLAEPLASGDPPTRAPAAHLRARIEYLSGATSGASAALVEEAALIASEQPERAARMLIDACEASLYAGQVRLAVAAGRRARELTPEDGSEDDCLADLALGEALIVSPSLDEATVLLERGIRLAERIDRHHDARCLTRASMALGWLDRPADGRELAARAVDVARERGGTGLLPYALEVLAWHDVRLGRWTTAYAESLEALALAHETGQTNMAAHCDAHLGLLDGARGHEAASRQSLEQALKRADEMGLAPLRQRTQCMLALVELGFGQLEAAIERLEQARRDAERVALHDREAAPWVDLVEAYVRTGQIEKAEATLAEFESGRLGTSPLWPRAAAAGCRGLVAGEDTFDEHFDEALALHGEIGDPFSVGRTRLGYGERLRRAGRRRDAREQLRAALATFDDLGAAPWADRARAELRASGEAARRREVSAGEQLTPQELQVASHVAQGKTNREVGAALFLSPRTVEAHLARIFRKLDIHSRGELIRLFATQPVATPPSGPS